MIISETQEQPIGQYIKKRGILYYIERTGKGGSIESYGRYPSLIQAQQKVKELENTIWKSTKKYKPAQKQNNTKVEYKEIFHEPIKGVQSELPFIQQTCEGYLLCVQLNPTFIYGDHFESYEEAEELKKILGNYEWHETKDVTSPHPLQGIQILEDGYCIIEEPDKKFSKLADAQHYVGITPINEKIQQNKKKLQTCPICHKEFDKKGNRKYCSECKSKYSYPKNKKREPIKCKNCGKEFIKTGSNQKYCSTKCKQRYYYHNPSIHAKKYKKTKNNQNTTIQPKKCKTCGEEFIPTDLRQKYCSINCNPNIRNISKKCVRCGEEFTPRPWQKTCDKCKNIQKIKHKKTCKHCGKEFTARANNQIFCSKKCGTEHNHKTPKTKKCVTCGREFKSSYQKSKYCSPDCNPKARNKTNTCIRCGEVFDVEFKWQRKCKTCREKEKLSNKTVNKSKQSPGDIQCMDEQTKPYIKKWEQNT